MRSTGGKRARGGDCGGGARPSRRLRVALAARCGAGASTRDARVAVRRPLHVRPAALRRVRRRVRRRAAVGARLSARRAQLHAHPAGDHAHQAAPRREQHLHARRSRALQLSDRLHVGARLLDDERRGSSTAMRSYLRKGGFVIFDDFRGEHWYNFEEQMRRVFPDGRLRRARRHAPDLSFVLRHQLARVRAATTAAASRRSSTACSRTTTRSKRLLLVANYNHDLGE